MKAFTALLCFGLMISSAIVMFADDKPSVSSKIPNNSIKGEVPLRPFNRFGVSIDKAFWYMVDNQKVGDRWYYETGVIAQERLFKNDVLHGKVRFYYPNGKLYWEKTYNNGLLDGPCVYWTNDGKEIGKSIMRKGTGLLREYNSDGTVASSCYYQSGLKHGLKMEWTYNTNEYQSSHEVFSYENGFLEGWTRLYTADGVLILEGMYKNNRRHGVFREWNRAGVLINDSPKYYIDAFEVTKEKFEKAAKNDRVLYRSLHSISNRPLPEKPKK